MTQREYSFVDYSEYDPGRGGPTPEYTFYLDDVLTVEVRDECYDPPDAPQTKDEALAVLKNHVAELKARFQRAEAFLTLAKEAEFVADEDTDEDED